MSGRWQLPRPLRPTISGEDAVEKKIIIADARSGWMDGRLPICNENGPARSRWAALLVVCRGADDRPFLGLSHSQLPCLLFRVFALSIPFIVLSLSTRAAAIGLGQILRL
ncbi:hypothetical protein BDV11DRAFT_156419 [Aspergillus similis]